MGTTTISVRAVDAAGNVTDRQFTYTVNAPPVPPVRPTSGPVTVVTPIGLGPAASTRPALVLSPRGLRAARHVRLRTARRRGLRVSFATPSGSRLAVVRLFRAETLVATRTLNVTGTERRAVRFRVRRTGLYRVSVRVGATRNTLGPAQSIRSRVVR